jgi:hypothetical protein
MYTVGALLGVLRCSVGPAESRRTKDAGPVTETGTYHLTCPVYRVLIAWTRRNDYLDANTYQYVTCLWRSVQMVCE